MDIGLWHQYVRSVILPLYEGRISAEPIRDPLTGKLLSGPLIIKTDSGPGRLSREACSIEFREEMAKKGVHILLSLPNGTACTAEMDQLFEKFKPACSKAALRIAAKKMHARFEARKQYKYQQGPTTIARMKRTTMRMMEMLVGRRVVFVT